MSFPLHPPPLDRLFFEQVGDGGGLMICHFLIFPSQRDKAQMSAQNVKWPCSSVSHSVSSSVALLFNYWCEQGDKKDRGDRDGARWKDRRP